MERVPDELIRALAESEQRRAELEERLHIIERGELVGQLASGILHDLNNLLTAISGHAELILAALTGADPIHEDAIQIQLAAAHAAELGREVLAIGHDPGALPAVGDLNAEVAKLRPTLARLLGERIALVVHEGPALGRVALSPIQISQIILNLALNSRDAMPEGGRLTIETARTFVDELAARRLGVTPGDFVKLAVSDTGVGMSDETMARVFQPFFTTKGERGTGLGLSMVHRLVTEAGGGVSVASQRGEWSTFAVHLPAARPHLA